MDRILIKAKQKIKNNKDTLIFCVCVTFAIGMITNAYMYFQDSFSHDSLNEFNGSEYNRWKIQLGRFLIPLYRIFTRGNLTLPWLVGICSLLWITLSVFFTIKLFNVKSKVFIALVSGIYTSNIAVIATTATYIHDVDVDMYALFMSVLAVFLWCRYKKSCVFSAICVFITLGLYQSYISVTITLMIIYFILVLLKQGEFKTVFLNGLKFVLLLLIVGIAYYIVFKAIMIFSNIEEISKYNTLDNMFSMTFLESVKNTIKTYVYTIYYFLFPYTYLSRFLTFGMTLVLIGVAGYIVLFRSLSKKIALKEKVLILTLITILPIATNISQVLSGVSHDLMRFALWLVYLFVLLIVYNVKEFDFDNDAKSVTLFIVKISKCVCVSILVIILLSNIILANEVYLKKDLEQDAALSYFTRVVDEMDSFDEYDRKSTAVVFIGRPEIFDKNMLGFGNSKYIVGSENSYALGEASPGYYKSYFEYKLHYSIIVKEDETPYIENKFVVDMPIFPEDGSLQMLDGTLVVKLGEIKKDD